MSLLRWTRRRMKTGHCLVLAGCTLFLLAVMWMMAAGEGILVANQNLAIFNVGNDVGGQERRVKGSTGLWLEEGESRAAWLPDTLDRALQQRPGKLPARRKLSRPDFRQPSVVVEEAPPGTFTRQRHSDNNDDPPFQDLEPRNESRMADPGSSPRVADPRSLDWVLAGSPVESRRAESARRRSNPAGEVEEESGNDDGFGPKEKDSEEKVQDPRVWVSPDGAVHSQGETDTLTGSSKNAVHKTYSRQNTRNPLKDSAARRATDAVHTNEKHVPDSSRNLLPASSNLRGEVPAARSPDPKKPPPPKPVPVTSSSSSSRIPQPTAAPWSGKKTSSARSTPPHTPPPPPPPNPNPAESVSASRKQPPPPRESHRPDNPAPAISSSSSKLHHQKQRREEGFGGDGPRQQQQHLQQQRQQHLQQQQQHLQQQQQQQHLQQQQHQQHLQQQQQHLQHQQQQHFQQHLHHQHPPPLLHSPPAAPSSSSNNNNNNHHNHNHVISVSRQTANFVEVADLVIYSAFRDDRLRAPLVRLLGVGPVSRRSPPLRLWCVIGSASAEPAPVSLHQSGDCRWSSRERRRRYCFYMFHCQIPDRLHNASTSLSSVVVVATEGKEPPSSSHPGERVRLRVILNANATTRHDRDVRSASGSAAAAAASFSTTRHVVGDVRSAAAVSAATIDDVISGSVAAPFSKTWLSSSSSSTTPKFAVCVVPPLFGKLSVLQIVEFVELNRLLGASHLVFYTFRVSSEVSRALSHYEQAGVVSVLPWNIPAPNDVWNKGESLAMTDCLYRSMHVFHYVIFSDVNEYFVPAANSLQRTSTAMWQAFMDMVARNPGSQRPKTAVAAYEIASVKMYPKATLVSSSSSLSKTALKSEASKFLTLRNTLRGKAPSDNFGNNTKLVVQPERVLWVDSESFVQPISELFVSEKVEPHLASVFRFTPKVCSQSNYSGTGSMAQSCDNLYEDRTIWRYKDALLERTKYVLRKLNQKAESKLT